MAGGASPERPVPLVAMSPQRTPDGPPPPPPVQKLRVQYARRGRLRFSSTRDFARALERALRRSGEPMAFSADEACDVGSDTGSPASQDYGPHGNKFTGTIDWAKIDIGADSHDHLITAEDKLNISMSRQ